MKEKHLRVLLSMIVISICLVSTVNAIGLGPLELPITVEKGKETQLVEYISVSNAETTPIHVTASVTGSIVDFITVDPQEFDMPAGPGLGTGKPRPVQDVKVIFKMPREVTKDEYTGEIVFTQKAVEGGVLGVSPQLGVVVKITIGEMAKAVFPTYMNAFIIVLIIVLIVSIIYRERKR
jgi:hypothetical protein